MKFRKDSVNWKKQKDNKRIQESHEKLKIGGIKIFSCWYATCETNEYFRRRIYLPLTEIYREIVLVHYLDEKFQLIKNNPFIYSNTMITTSSEKMEIESKIPKPERNESLREITTSTSSPFDPSLIDFSFLNSPSSFVPNNSPSILDFSPEWDYTEGGAKLLITCNNLPPDCNYFCSFDQTEVPAELIKEGVLRCKVPPHSVPGFVDFSITLGNFLSVTDSKKFEYKLNVTNKEEDLLNLLGSFFLFFFWLTFFKIEKNFQIKILDRHGKEESAAKKIQGAFRTYRRINAAKKIQKAFRSYRIGSAAKKF